MTQTVSFSHLVSIGSKVKMRSDIHRWALVTLLLALSGSSLLAQERNLTVTAMPNEQRLALVIGNSTYKDSPLANPANDAADMAQALENVGFKVILRINSNTREMRQAIREFGTGLRRAQIGLFYFAGHGVQIKGGNYLIPVGANIENEADVEDLAIDANYALRTMEEAQVKVSIMILDACRNNPFARSFRSASRGLAQMVAPTGSIVAFATAPGAVAADGSGRNGLYTKHLLANLSQPDTDILKVFQRTRAAVVAETSGKQTPWESTSLTGDFYFRTGKSSFANAPQNDNPFDGSWEGQSEVWHIKAVVENGRARGIARCFRALGNKTWSSWGPTFDIALPADGRVSATLDPHPGWTERRLVGTFPDVSIIAHASKLNCPNGRVLLRRTE